MRAAVSFGMVGPKACHECVNSPPRYPQGSAREGAVCPGGIDSYRPALPGQLLHASPLGRGMVYLVLYASTELRESICSSADAYRAANHKRIVTSGGIFSSPKISLTCVQVGTTPFRADRKQSRFY